MLFAIVGVVVSVDVLILLVGTAIPQSRLTATLTTDVEHPSSVNVRMNNDDENIHNYPWLTVVLPVHYLLPCRKRVSTSVSLYLSVLQMSPSSG